MTVQHSPTVTNISTPQRPPYPAGVPSKFSPEGSVQRFTGNTTLWHLPTDSPLLPGLRVLHDALSSDPLLSQRVQLLPPASWHMTVLDGVREKERTPELWPPGKQLQELGECTKEFSQGLTQLGLELEMHGLGPPYRMRVRGFDPAATGIGLEVEGVTAEEERRMRRLRDMLANRLGLVTPNHESYVFHISVAYLLRHVDGQERDTLNRFFAQHLPAVRQEFELGPVEFCSFENMYAFQRLFYLGERREYSRKG